MSSDAQTRSTAGSSVDPVLNSGSLAEFAEASIGDPPSATLTLDVARHHAFTGEITFRLMPEVRVYLDGGVVYHAERSDEPTISQALVSGGVITAEQLERGMVRVGDVEHLGRLFERDATIDRDAVVVVVEAHTNIVVSDLVRAVVAPVSISAYRHHPSGLHRWFVAPAGAHNPRPVSSVAQVDRSVVDDLPGLGRGSEAIRIEWNEPDPGGLGFETGTSDVLSRPGEFDLQAELDRFDADRADWAMAPSAAFVSPNPSAESPLAQFHIVWPDGTSEDPLIPSELAAEVVELTPVDDELVDLSVETFGPATFDDVGVDEPAVEADLDLGQTLGIEMEPVRLPPPVVVDRLPAPDSIVPDEVAAAVRRALEAIGEASTSGRALARPLGSSKLPRLEIPDFLRPHSGRLGTREASIGQSSVVRPPAPPAPPAPVGFAPPTLDMSAEAIYRRQAEAETQPTGDVPSAGDSIDLAVGRDPGVVVADLPLPGPASVVFVDEPETAPSVERRGALRRLIKSLRSGD